MRVLVTGGRGYSDYEAVKKELDKLRQMAGTFRVVLVVIEGGADGADALARRWCEENPSNIHHIREDAKWDDMEAVPCVRRLRRDGTTYNAAAGGIRNQKMIDDHHPTQAIAFPGGKGTKDMVARLKKAGIRTKVVS